MNENRIPTGWVAFITLFGGILLLIGCLALKGILVPFAGLDASQIEAVLGLSQIGIFGGGLLFGSGIFDLGVRLLRYLLSY